MKTVFVLVMAIALVVSTQLLGMAFAQDTGLTDVSGTIGAQFEILDVPDSFDFDSADPLTPGHLSIATWIDGLHVQSNVPWVVTVEEEDGDGKMSNSDGNTLQKVMEVHSVEARFLSDSPQSITVGPAGDNVRTVHFLQDVLWTDAPGDYSITVAFRIGAQV